MGVVRTQDPFLNFRTICYLWNGWWGWGMGANPSTILWGPWKWRGPKGHRAKLEGRRGVGVLGEVCSPPHHKSSGGALQRSAVNQRHGELPYAQVCHCDCVGRCVKEVVLHQAWSESQWTILQRLSTKYAINALLMTIILSFSKTVGLHRSILRSKQAKSCSAKLSTPSSWAMVRNSS